MIVDGAKLMAFVPTSDLARARGFYHDTLGLELSGEDPFGLSFDAGGTALRVAVVGDFSPGPGTQLGWTVPDVAAAVDALSERGVRFERYERLEQDERGIWITPGGAAKVAWFTDPDGNTLSLTGPNP